MKTAFLYAGQGSQRPNMGRDFYDEYESIREIFDMTPLGVSVKTLCFESDAAALSDTASTQPCMGAFAAAVTKLLYQEGIVPDAAAGLSLGEYGALHAAGVFNSDTLLNLLAFRGRAMAEASKGIEHKMTAVLSADSNIAEKAVSEISETAGNVWCCNYNCPGQIVIGGLAAHVDEAAALALSRGARRALPLNVGGPFHTPFMKPAAEALGRFMDTVAFSKPSFPVIPNITGLPPEPDADIRNTLKSQVYSPVLFEKSLRTLASLGISCFLEIGPGKALAGFVRKTLPDAEVFSIDTTEDFRAAISKLRSKPA